MVAESREVVPRNQNANVNNINKHTEEGTHRRIFFILKNR